MTENKDYLNKDYKYIQVSREYHELLTRWISSERMKLQCYSSSVPPEERAKTETWLKEQGERLLIGGIYHWGRIFGEGYDKTWLFPYQVDDYEAHDIIHVNLYGLTESLTTDIRERIGWNTKTKIVLNMDYSVELFQRCKDFEKPYRLARDIDNADMIFATEEMQRDALEHLLGGRKVHLISHPNAIHEIKALFVPPDMRIVRNINNKPALLINLHRWDMNVLFPYLAFRPTNLNQLDYIDYVSNINRHEQEELNRAKLLYSNILDIMPYTRFMEFCNMLYAALDIYTCYSYGRFVTDMGALGVVTVGSDRCRAQRIVWPELACNPYDVKKQFELLKKIREDKDFYTEMMELGRNRVDYFNYENCRKRFLDALYGDGVEDENVTL